MNKQKRDNWLARQMFTLIEDEQTGATTKHMWKRRLFSWGLSFAVALIIYGLYRLVMALW